jgi:hypothetical protein
MIFTALAILALSGWQTPPPSPPSAAATIVFGFENPQLQPSSYSIEIHEDGSGHYKSMPAPPTPGTTIASASEDFINPQPMNREIRIADPLRSQLFAAARSHHFFAIQCEAPKIHVAFTGKKSLTYSGPDGHGSCTYNYSHDPELNRLADALVAIAFTLEEGQRLTVEHEHSPLALDAELESLQDAARGGRALQIENIAPQLQSIAIDEAVLVRARKRAGALLAATEPPAR